jgi:benzylsuccinate CoA-transferase BbsF subunit
VCGFYEVTGWDDRAPGGPFNAYTDTIAPRFLATALVAALDHRRRTGEGQYIDGAQMESSLHLLGPELLEAQITGKNARRAGNEDPSGCAARLVSVSWALTSGSRSPSRTTSNGARCAAC